MTLSELLTSITNTKAQLKTKLGVSNSGTTSDALYEYPTILKNVLAYYYNYGYKQGWAAVAGSSYTGNDPKPYTSVDTVVPSWQGGDTSDLAVLVNVMSAIADCRVAMKTVFSNYGITVSDTFSTYPDAITSAKTTVQSNGNAAGRSAAAAVTPSEQVSAPIIQVLSAENNLIGISSSTATSLKWWVQSSAPSTTTTPPSSGVTTVDKASFTHTITSSENGKYFCVKAYASGKTDSITVGRQLSYYVAPVELPSEPTIERVSPTSNYLKITQTASGGTLNYTTNSGTNWRTTSSSSIQIAVSSQTAAHTFGAYTTLNGQSSATVWYEQTFTPYVAPSTNLEEPTSTPSENPFWIYCTNSSGQYGIVTDTTNVFEISTTRDFSNLVTPSTSGSGHQFTLSAQKYYFIRAYNVNTSTAYSSFTIPFKPSNFTVNIGGNLRSLAPNGSRTLSSMAVAASAFNGYFKNNTAINTAIVDASLLFFPDSSTKSYYQMFESCSYLTKIPATISASVATDAFKYCFRYCTKLTEGCTLTASSIGDSGYSGMFWGCTAMTKTGEISATSVGTYGFYNMFYNCPNLVTGPSQLNVTSISTSCFEYMFERCSKLKIAPVLNTKAPSYATNSYKEMFLNCSSLEQIEVNGWDKWGSSNTQNWVSGVASSGVFIKGENCGWYVLQDGQTDSTYGVHRGVSGIPEGWQIDDASL